MVNEGLRTALCLLRRPPEPGLSIPYLCSPGPSDKDPSEISLPAGRISSFYAMISFRTSKNRAHFSKRARKVGVGSVVALLRCGFIVALSIVGISTIPTTVPQRLGTPSTLPFCVPRLLLCISLRT